MWIMSALGFFSIARKSDGAYHVRGRLERDLRNLKEAAGLAEPVSESDRADYRWRIVTDADGYAKVLVALSLSVDYPNFKDEVKKRPDQEPKLGAYHSIWAKMYGLQLNDEVDSGKRDPLQESLDDLGARNRIDGVEVDPDDIDALMGPPDPGGGWKATPWDDDESEGTHERT